MRTMTRALLVSLLLCLCSPVTAFSDHMYYDASGQRWIVSDQPAVRYETSPAPTQVVIQIITPPAVPAPVAPPVAPPVPTWGEPAY